MIGLTIIILLNLSWSFSGIYLSHKTQYEPSFHLPCFNTTYNILTNFFIFLDYRPRDLKFPLLRITRVSIITHVSNVIRLARLVFSLSLVQPELFRLQSLSSNIHRACHWLNRVSHQSKLCHLQITYILANIIIISCHFIHYQST